MNLLGVLPYWTFGPWPKEPFMVGSIPLQVHLLRVDGGRGFAPWLQLHELARGAKRGLERRARSELRDVPVGHSVGRSRTSFNVIFYEPQLLAEDPMELFRVWGSISSYGGLFWRHPRLLHLVLSQSGCRAA